MENSRCFVLQSQQCRCDREVDEQGDGIDDGGDHGAGGDGGVKSDFVHNERQRRADEFGGEDGAEQGERDDERHGERDAAGEQIVHGHQLDKGDGGERDAAEQGGGQFLAQHAQDVAEAHVAERERADDGDRAL